MAKGTSKINIESLAATVSKMLEDYQDVIQEDVVQAVDKTAKETVKEIRQNAKSSFKGSKYAKSWKMTKDISSRNRLTHAVIVHANEDGYRIAHLLEKGHALVRNGKIYGRVNGRKHIEPAAQNAEKELMSSLKQLIERRG